MDTSGIKSIKIEVFDRHRLSNIDSLELFEDTILISVTDIGNKFTQLNENIERQLTAKLFIRFDDVELGDKHCITEKQAIMIDSFVNCYSSNISSIIISCDGGVSRSAAIAAALLLKLGQDDMIIWGNGKFCPNISVFKSLLNIIFGQKHSINIKEREELNISEWRKINNI